jgi:CheY-like chemotaxis protein
MKSETRSKSSKKRILLIEDDEPTRESTLFKLEKAGFETDFSEDGEEGLEKLKKDKSFDVILLDLRLPKGDGFVFLEQKNKDKSIKDIPVVIFSNFSQPEFIKRAMSLGAVGYLVKAYHSLEEIVEEVTRCLEGGQCRIDY